MTPLMESPDSGTTEDVSPGDVAPHRGQQEHYAGIRMQILFFPLMLTFSIFKPDDVAALFVPGASSFSCAVRSKATPYKSGSFALFFS